MAQDDKKAAIAGMIAEAAAAEPAAEQLELLAPPTRPSLSDAQREQVDAAIRHDRRGRPPGAKNKTTREMLDFVRKFCGDPLERRFRWAMHTPETLAIELGCSKFEAFQLLDRMWADLARYFYGQQANVDASGNAAVPRLTMVIGGQTAAAIGPNGAVRPPWEYLDVANAGPQQNQQVIDHEPAVSHGEPSHDDG